MSKFVIEIDENALNEQITRILNTILNDSLRSRYSGAGCEISAAVKELVYSRKDEIIDKVVDRATAEIVRKGLPKLLQKLGGAEA
jgi:hypothetical protein